MDARTIPGQSAEGLNEPRLPHNRAHGDLRLTGENGGRMVSCKVLLHPVISIQTKKKGEALVKSLSDLLLRREFLKNAGFGSLALGSLPALARVRAADAEITNWIFAAFSGAATLNGVVNRAAMEGHGFVQGQDVVGVGSFVLFDNASAVPKTIFSSGTWKATNLNSFNLIGSWGAFAAGIVDMQIKLLQNFPLSAVIEATLRVPCNIPAGGLFTGEEEGFVLTIPGAPQGPYSPLVPPFGGSVFARFEGGN